MYDNKPYLNLNFSNSYPTTNLCNNSNDSPNAWKSCYNSSYSYLLRMNRITITENGSSKDYVIFTNSSSSTNPATLNSTYVQNFNSTVGGIHLEIPSGLLNAYVLFPITDSYTIGYSNLTGTDYTVGYYFDTDSPEYRSYNDWSSLNKTFQKGSLIPYRSSLMTPVIPDDPSGGSSVDLSGVISAITLIPATIIMVFLFKMISNIFLNRKVRG